MSKQINDYLKMDKSTLIEVLQEFLSKSNKLGYTSKYIPPEKLLLDKIKTLPILKKEGEVITNSGPLSVLIQGENFHALQILQATHTRKIKLIFIDLPYNKGNGDFVFNGKVVEKDDPERSSKWISSLEKRMPLLRNLLTEDGCIMICIDQQENHNLKNIGISFFGADNFVSDIIWKTRAGTNGAGCNISVDHEHILIFAKNKKLLNFNGKKKDYSIYKNPDNDLRGDWKLGDLKNPHDDFKMLGVLKDPETGKKYKGYWRISPKNYNEYIDDKRIVFPSDGKGVPKLKIFKNELKSEVNPFSSIIEGHLTQHGTRSLQTFFKGKKIFNYPKPPNLLKELVLQVLTGNSDCVLDCYAGSGTLGQVILEINNELKTHHRFVLVQDNFNKVCDKICFPRLLKTVNGVNDFVKRKNYKYDPQGGNILYLCIEYVDAADTVKDNYRIYINNLAEIVSLVNHKKYSRTIFEGFQLLSDGESAVVLHDSINPDTVIDFLINNCDKYKSIEVYSLFLNEEDFDKLSIKNVKINDLVESLLKSRQSASELIK